MIGKTLSHFQITAKLGEGGMGEVYRAQDTKLGRDVAIKVLPAEVARDRDWLERFEREARAASALNHPHICTIHELGEHEGQPFLVMELLEGETLKEQLQRGSLPSDRAIELGIQLADALAAAHGKGIVHRDIKPANLFLTDRGDLKILDFGLAKLRAEIANADSEMPTARADRTLTQAGSTLGTVAYMSPEQARGETLGPRTDLFSVGVVLYEVVTGRLPFDGATSAVIFSEILGKQPVDPGQLEPSVPEPLRTTILRLLEKDPELRYQSAADLRSDLKRLRRDTSSHSHVVAATERVPAAAPSNLRSHRRWIWIAAAVLIALAGLLVWQSWPTSPPGEASAPTPEPEIATITAEPTQPSITIAVLPFQNLGADNSIDYLRLAVPDEIATALSRVRTLTVRPFTSAASLAEPPGDLASVGKQLRATNLVTGQFYLEGEQLNLTLEAVDVEDDRVVWRGRVTAPANDLLNLRSAVAEQVQSELLPELGLSEVATLGGSDPQDPEAYELYVRSLAMPNRLEPNRQAIEMLEQATELDPGYAPAWAALNIRYYYESILTEGDSLALQKAEDAAETAIRHDPSLVEPLLYLVTRRADIGDFEGAWRRAQELVDNRPDSALSWFARSYVYRYAGLLEEAQADCDRALALDPVNTRIRSCAIAFLDPDDMSRAREFLNLDYGSDWFFDAQGHILLIEGRIDEAITSFESGAEGSVGFQEGEFLRHCGERSPAAEAAAARLEEIGTALNDSEVDYSTAAVLAACGQNEQALRLLRRAIEKGYCSYPAVDRFPEWRALRGNPEFAGIREEAIACQKRFLEAIGKASG